MGMNSHDNVGSDSKAVLSRVLWAVAGVGLTVVVVEQLTVHKVEVLVRDPSHWLHIAEFAWLAPLLGRAAKWRNESAYFSGAAVVLGLHYFHFSGLQEKPVWLAVVAALIAVPIVVLVPLYKSKKFPGNEPSSLTVGQLWAVFATFLMFALLHWPPVADWQLAYDDPLWRGVIGALALVVSGVSLKVFLSKSDRDKSESLDLWAVIVPLALMSFVAFKVFQPSSSLDHSWLDLSVGAFSCYILLRIVARK